MTTEIATTESSDLSTMTIADLREEIRLGLEMSATGIVRAARAIRELERRGEDLSELRRQTVVFLRLVACNQLLPEAYLYFLGYDRWTKAVSLLPIPDQARLARGETVSFVVPGTNGQKWTVLQVNPRDLHVSKIAQLIGPSGLRDEGEQVAWLESQTQPRAKPKRKDVGSVVIDRKKGVLLTKRGQLTPAQVVVALASLVVPTDDEEPSRSITIKLTEEEYRALSVNAAQADVDPKILARRALLAFALTRTSTQA